MAGAAVAKYLRFWSRRELSVALIEKDASYTSNIMSNEVLTGKRASVTSLNYDYTGLVSKYGVTRIQGSVTTIDPINKTVTYATSSGNVVATYDRLVLAPGLEFDLMPGMTSAAQYDSTVPHAWKAGAQTTLLRNQLKAMPDFQNVVITIPLAPYRCPPGPYERACVVADWLRTNKPNAKVVVLDANNEIQAQKTNFQNAFKRRPTATVWTTAPAVPSPSCNWWRAPTRSSSRRAATRSPSRQRCSTRSRRSARPICWRPAACSAAALRR